jgi:flagellar hook-associated protein 2
LAHGFTINSSLTHSGGTVVAFAAGQNATTGNTQNGRDAQFTVNGLSITSASNSITNAIPGVSLSLVKTGTASVDVSTDHTALKDTIKAFIADYNKLRDFFANQSTSNPLTGKQLPLANDVILRQVLSDIRATLLGANANGGTYSYLSEIGIEFEQSGQLKFVETTFDSAMGSDPAEVKKLFQGTTGVEGVFDLMKTRLENLDATDGMIKMQRDSLDTVLDNYRDRILAQEMRLEVRRSELTRMYAAADQAISQLNAMNAQLQSIRY